MRNILSIINIVWLLFISNGLKAQIIELKTYYDAKETQVKEIYQVQDSVLMGDYKAFYKNGNLKVSGRYRYNIPVGVWTYYFENGNMKMRGGLRNNSNYGPWEYYYENGNLRMEGKILDGLRQGYWSFYYKDGSLKSFGLYVNNKRSGEWEYYHPDGSLKATAKYKRGRGLYTEFYPSGSKMMEGIKENGENEGTWTFYYEDGDIEAIGDYLDGEKTGFWQYFFPNGMVSSEGYYKNDKQVGEWVYYYENGKVSSKGKMKNGDRDGYWSIYNEEGVLKGETVFKNGIGDYKEYYENGQLKVEGKIIEGKKNGKWTYYYEDGTIEGECIFKNDEGRYIGYYKDGTKKMAGKIQDDLMIGLWELYEPDGSLAGYYKPYYDEEGPVFKLEEKSKTTKTPREWKQRRLSEFRFNKRKFTPFKPEINEFRGLIVAYNPFATLLGGFPLSAEYYIEERLGHELQFNLIRDPFFTSDNNIEADENFKRGFSLALKQKFYVKESKIGMYYFGHELRFTHIDHKANISDNSDPSMPNMITAEETKYEYSILGGKRLVKETNSSGFTVDIFFGVGFGYRNYQKNYPPSTEYDAIFEDVPKSDLSVALRAGLNIGYIISFKRK